MQAAVDRVQAARAIDIVQVFGVDDPADRIRISGREGANDDVGSGRVDQVAANRIQSLSCFRA